MPATPDRHPGRLVEDEEILLRTNAGDPSEAGATRYNGTSFRMRDTLGTFNPRGPTPSGSGDLLMSIDGSTWSAVTPITQPENGVAGWLVNDLGTMIVVG